MSPLLGYQIGWEPQADRDLLETASDYAFTQFLVSVTPADFSTAEWQLFQHLRLRVAA